MLGDINQDIFIDRKVLMPLYKGSLSKTTSDNVFNIQDRGSRTRTGQTSAATTIQNVYPTREAQRS